jgi:hypothetical protein
MAARPFDEVLTLGAVHDIDPQFGDRRSCIVRMDTELSSAINSLWLSPNLHFLESFSYLIAGVEFGSFWKRGHHMESAGIPNDCDHESSGLHHVTFSVGHWFFRCEPDALVIRGKLQRKLIQSHDVVPATGLLSFKHCQELSRQVDPGHLVIVLQMMGDPPKTVNRQTKRLS